MYVERPKKFGDAARHPERLRQLRTPCLSDTPRTRGFHWRVDALYHLALGTPAEKRKPLVWIRSGHALANRLDEAPR